MVSLQVYVDQPGVPKLLHDRGTDDLPLPHDDLAVGAYVPRGNVALPHIEAGGKDGEQNEDEDSPYGGGKDARP